MASEIKVTDDICQNAFLLDLDVLLVVLQFWAKQGQKGQRSRSQPDKMVKSKDIQTAPIKLCVVVYSLRLVVSL